MEKLSQALVNAIRKELNSCKTALDLSKVPRYRWRGHQGVGRLSLKKLERLGILGVENKVCFHVKLSAKSLKVIKLREAGNSFVEIGKTLNISSGWAGRLYSEAKLSQQYHHDGINHHPYYGLSVKVSNVCLSLNLNNQEEIRAAIKDGTLNPNKTGKGSCRGYGWSSHVEVHKWLGLAEPIRAKPESVQSLKAEIAQLRREIAQLISEKK